MEVDGVMKVVYPRCCGLDVHKKTVVACLLTPETKEVRTFRTTTAGVGELGSWLVQAGCTQVAMESTGIYWRPLYNLLEEQPLEVWVVNAHHIKAVPGRKTNVKDAEWLADLLRHGLVQPSLIPDRGRRELQKLIRYRQTLVAERADEANRIQLPWVEAQPPGPTGDAGGGQHQAGGRDQQRAGGQWTSHAPGDD